MTVILVAVGGAAGAVLRHLVGRWLARWWPAGTLVVNVAGSLLLGVLVGSAVAHPAYELLGVGLCGSLTTYSTFGADTVRLLSDGLPRRAALNALVNVTLAVAAAFLGVAAGAAL